MGGMRIVSLEQLFEGTMQMSLSGYLGKVFDGFSRKRAILTVVPINNFTICLAAGLILTCLSIDPGSPLFIVCLVLSMVTCAVNRLFLNAEKFIVSKDWIVVLGDDSTLSNMNAIFTSLDQFANVISPLVTGALVTLLDIRMTVLIFGIVSTNNNECLHTKKRDEEKDEFLKSSTEDTSNQGVISTYWRQSVFPAAVGMALLFMTVLGFDGLAVGYGSSAGLPEYLIGAFRSYGSVAGILGAFSYAFFEKRYSVATSGVLGLIVQQIFIILAVVSIWLPGSPMNLSGYFGNFTIQGWWHDMAHAFDGQNTTNTNPNIDWKHFTSDGVSLDSIFVFLIAIASARYGLWCLDLAITHLMQVNVPEKQRNTVFGVHNALCQTFSVLKDLLVIILPLPATFGLCIMISYGFVTVGHAFFIFYLFKSKLISTVGRRLSKLSMDS
ncbi:unnamed protein product [Caenorhabditis bovis]|uniref:Solute carrier family 40 member n=1 Tax=Caenorhabditis bovis TaxID=2654633 RepID=A0A8S1E5J1_9PELO|nr:unnamed protein product [Caenorhabditis bovis]